VLAANPRDAQALDRMALARRFLAELLYLAGAVEASGVEADRSAGIAAAQLALEPDNADWQLAAAKAWLLQGRLALHADGAAGARRVLHAHAAALDQWTAGRDGAWAWEVEVPMARALLLADVSLAEGDPAAALRAVAAAEATLDAVADVQARVDKARAWRVQLVGRSGLALAALGDPTGAARAWERLLAHAGDKPLGAEVLAWTTRANAVLGRGRAAARGWARLRAAGFDVPGFEEEGEAARVAAKRGGRP
jgi:hypothetical protein